jgi:CheY-like chemotaxis protein
MMARPTILVVDDDPVFLDSVQAVLQTSYRVTTAANGSEALVAIQVDPPDLIVLDVMMDHMSEGFDVARTVRGNETTELIPIIILTGVDRVYNLRMEVDESWVPADRYLEKPVSPGDLLREVNELIGPGESLPE